MADLLQERITTLEKRLAAQPKSPVFAWLAGYYLQTGKAEQALRLCDEGLAHHPYYSTAHLIKGKALLALQMLAEAKHEFNVVQEFLPTNETVARLSANIDLSAAPAVKFPSETVATEETILQEEIAVEEPQPVQMEEPVAEEPVPTFEAEAPFQAEKLAQPEQSDFGATVSSEPTPEAETTPTAFEAEQPQPETISGFGDTGFGEPARETPQATEEVDPLAALRTETQEEPAADPFGFGATTETPTAEPSTAETEQGSSLLDMFGQAEEPTPQTSEPAVTDDGFSGLEALTAMSTQAETPETPADNTGYDQFASTIQNELAGTENTMTLEEFFAGNSDPASPEPNQIEELAEKLKTPKKITPVINFSQKETRTASEADTAAGSGFVTPTLAEIYVKQGWFDDAIKAYRTLALNKPAEREKFEARIAELEEMKKQQG
ncbi:MAG: hypothetical protein HY088_05285 [Ignavibacteriales bacterium]|nr:hypothetical protein [Ignavibacteriales bacterium]